MASNSFVTAGFGWPYRYQRGVGFYDPEKSFNGYTLWAPFAGRECDEPDQAPGVVYLMNMSGNVVHTWKTQFPVWYARLMPNGHLTAMMRCTKGLDEGRPGYGNYYMGGATGILMELDWDGNILFQYFDPTMHHDFRKLPNGNWIYVVWEKVPADLAVKVRGGQKGTEHKDGTMFTDAFREIDPSGRVVWEWHCKDHLDPAVDIIGAIHPREEWTHINDVDVMPDGNIMSDSRHTDGAFIIDRQSGDVIWRWGNVAYLDAESDQVEHRDTRDPKTMGGPHDAHTIGEGFPGEGNMLIYDNGMYVYQSRALEVDIKTGEIVWQTEDYGVEGYIHGRVHFSPMISGVDRLPNGNTLVCGGADGILFEVSPDGQIVWHWVRPAQSSESAVTWGIFRALRYSPTYCPQFAKLPPAEGVGAS
jgi:hypothetical protein